MTRCHPCSYLSSFEFFRVWGGPLLDTIKKIAYSVLQTLGELFTLRYKAVAWNFQNQSHLKELPAFIFLSPPCYSSDFLQNDDFGNLAQVYRTYMGIASAEEFASRINQQLKKGYCHGQAVRLITRVKENKTSLAQEIPLLNSEDSEITRFQILEEFREALQGHQIHENKIKALLPLEEKTSYFGQGEDEGFKSSLSQTVGLVLVRLSNNTQGHTLLLELEPERSVFGFYNSNCSGYYEYSDLGSFYNALSSHIATHVDFATYRTLYFYSK